MLELNGQLDGVRADFGADEVVVQEVEVDGDLDEAGHELDPHQVVVHEQLVDPAHHVEDLVAAEARHVGARDDLDLVSSPRACGTRCRAGARWRGPPATPRSSAGTRSSGSCRSWRGGRARPRGSPRGK